MFKMYHEQMTDMFINIHNRFSLSCFDHFSVNTSDFILLLVCSHFLHVTKPQVCTKALHQLHVYLYYDSNLFNLTHN